MSLGDCSGPPRNSEYETRLSSAASVAGAVVPADVCHVGGNGETAGNAVTADAGNGRGSSATEAAGTQYKGSAAQAMATTDLYQFIFTASSS